MDRFLYQHSIYWGIKPPLKSTILLFLAKPSPPPLTLQTVQAPPPFLGNPPSILDFREPPPKNRISR